MARIAGVQRGSLFQRIVFAFVRRAIGQVPEPLRIAAHSAAVFKGHAKMEQSQQAARALPAAIKILAQARVASLVGCPF